MLYHHIKYASGRKSQKVPLFLAVVGYKTLYAFNVFQQTQAEEVNYESVQQGWKEYCTPHQDETCESDPLKQLLSKEAENIEDFMTNLRLKRNSCFVGS